MWAILIDVSAPNGKGVLIHAQKRLDNILALKILERIACPQRSKKLFAPKNKRLWNS